MATIAQTNNVVPYHTNQYLFFLHHSRYLCDGTTFMATILASAACACINGDVQQRETETRYKNNS